MGFFKRIVTYTTPSADILRDPVADITEATEYTQDTIAALVAACGVPCTPQSMVVGASVVQYHLKLVNLRDYPKIKRVAAPIGAKLHRNVSCADSSVADFALVVGRVSRSTVPLKTAMLTTTFDNIKSPVAATMGADISGRTVAVNIADMPHMLIAGATGSGKSVLLHSIIVSMLFKGLPHDLRYVMIDPKQIELTKYDGIPHLMKPVITSVDDALETLEGLCILMDRRYKDIRRGKTGHPRIVVVVDELADLMATSRKRVEPAIVRLAQLGRAAGIHLIIATQRPDVKVVTSHIRDNLPARVALAMTPGTGSRVVGVPGADKLAGKGDALFQSPNHIAQPVRFQAAYTSPEDIDAVVRYWKSREARKPL